MESEHFSWFPGMGLVRPDGSTDRIMDWSEAKLPNTDGIPDRDDPGNKGWLLHMVREAWKCPCAHVAKTFGGEWVLCDLPGQLLHVGCVDTGAVVAGRTEWDALEAALLAAPPKEES